MTGFAPKELQTSNGIWRVDMMKCPYHDTCTEIRLPRVVPLLLCDSDEQLYQLHPKLIWREKYDAGARNDRCDFCMKVRK